MKRFDWITPDWRRIVILFGIWIVIVKGGRSGTACYKDCNGHGVCSKWNTCDCFEGYEGYDCAKKSCPTGPAFVDIPSSSTNAHANVECSGQGSCDYHTGLCKCHPGYSGLNCGKTYCLNECNGHGQCISLGTAAFDNDGYHLNRTNTYALWDAERMFGCNCEYGWQGPDCSQRICEYGLDPRSTTGPAFEKVKFVCDCDANCRGRFKLRLFGKELKGWLTPLSTTSDMLSMILSAPGVFQNASTLAYPSIRSLTTRDNDTICEANSLISTEIQFRRNYGDIQPLSIIANNIRGGTIYFETEEIITCNCMDTPCNGTFRVSFDGEMSNRISSFDNGSAVLLALRNMRTFQNAPYTISATTDQAICVAQEQRNFTITFQGSVGNAPKIGLWSSIVNQQTPTFYYSNRTTGILQLITSDGRDDNVAVCNGIGRCDFTSGQCICPPGWGFDPNLGECGRFTVNSSVWTGLGRCVGVIDISDVGKPLGKTNLDLRPNYPTQVYISMNPIRSNTNVSAIYLFPWIAEQAWGAEVDRGAGQLFLNLTSNQSAGPLVLDTATDRLFFLDRNPLGNFIGFTHQFPEEANGTYVVWKTITTPIYTMTLDAYFGRRKLYWSVPGGLGLEDGGIYWAYIDDPATPTVYSLTATIGQAYLYNPRGLAIHYPQERIYWTDRNGSNAVLRSCAFDGSNYRQDHFFTTVDNESISMNITDLVIHFRNNNTAFLLDIGDDLTKIIAINLDAPIQFNDSEAIDSRFTEFYFSPRILNVTTANPIDNGIITPGALFLDDRNQYVLWTEPSMAEIRFSRYNHTIWRDIEGSGIAFNGHTVNPENSLDPYRFIPVGMVFDRGLGTPRWGNVVDCYGNGICGGIDGNFQCQCFEGYEGDCQITHCPKGKAWFHEPRVDNIAHDIYTECSNMGVCNYGSGLCECRHGYEGAACERSSCPGDPLTGAVCYNRGRCLSLKELGRYHVDEYLSPAPVNYGSFPNDPETWDADMIYGCLPDQYGWFQTLYNISTASNLEGNEYTCPYGYNRRMSDPVYSQGQNYSSVYEIQELICSAWRGSFQLRFRGQVTTPIFANATAVQLQRILQRLSVIGPVKVTMTGSRLCSDVQIFQTNITFLAQFGRVPLLEVVNNELRGYTNTVTINHLQSGSPESFLECSGHGECDRSRGICQCWEGYGPSDGLGNKGNHPDCGYSFV